MQDAWYNERTIWPQTPVLFDEKEAKRKGAKWTEKETLSCPSVARQNVPRQPKSDHVTRLHKKYD